MKRVLLICSTLILSTFLVGQTSISGTVTDSKSGKPLIGANVLAENSGGIGTTTDTDGNYSLTLPAVIVGDVNISVAYIGYKKVTGGISVSGVPARRDFALDPDILKGDMIVVTGQGIGVDKRRLSTTIETVGEDKLGNTQTTQLEYAMQAAVPSMKMDISGGQPGAASSIRLRGYGSISGASTPVIYVDGMRVNNGYGGQLELHNVIAGGASEGASAIADIPIESIERIEVIKGGAAATLYGSDASNGVIQIFTKSGTAGKTQFTFGMENGTKEPNSEYFLYEESADILYKTAESKLYRLGISGGNQRILFNFSGSAYEDDGWWAGSGGPSGNGGNMQKKYSMRSKVSAKMANGLDYMGSFGMTSHQYSRIGVGDSYNPYSLLEFGTYGDPDTMSVTRFNELKDKHQSWIDLSDYQVRVKRFQHSHSISYNPNEKISTKVTLGMDMRSSRNTQVVTNEVTRFTGNAGIGEGYINKSERFFYGLNGDAQISYKEDFGDISLLANGGYSFFKNHDNQYRINAQNVVDGSRSINNSAETFSDDYLLAVANFGYYGQVNVGFKNRYFVEFGMRSDESTAFGQDFGAQTYPKFGISYNIGSEPFFKTLVPSIIMSDAKLRYSKGSTGNWPKPYENERTLAPNSYLGSNAFTFDNPGDATLGPEYMTTTEIGADLSLIDDRLNLTFTSYKSTTEDALMPTPPSTSSGLGYQLRNIGTIENTGIELALDANVLNFAGFDLNVNYSWNDVDNKVVDLGGKPPVRVMNFVGIMDAYAIEGEPIGVIRANTTYFDSEGNIDSTVFGEELGGVAVTNFGNFGLTLKYKSIATLYVDGSYQKGGHQGSALGLIRLLLGDPSGGGMIAENMQGKASPFSMLNHFWFPTDYVKLRNVTFSINVPNKYISKTGLGAAEIFVRGNNLALWTDAPFDPEQEIDAFGTTQGSLNMNSYNYGILSVPKSIDFGFNLTF